MPKDLHNREAISKSQRCGCIYCHTIFPCSQITQWTDEGRTALCPVCGVDRVVCEANYDLALIEKAAWRAEKDGPG